MKRLVVFLAVFLFLGGALAVHAQDLIILRDGSVIEAKVTEISPSEIRYKRANHLDGPTIVVPVPTVLSIRYANGKVDQFNAAPVAPAAPAPAGSAPAGAPATAGNTALPGTAQTAVAIAGAAGLPGGDILSLQDALNKIPAIPVAGKNLKFIFSGETWRAQVNGSDTLSGTLTFQAAEDGGIITLTPEHAYLRGKQIPAPAGNILLEYTAGPPMSLRSLSKKEQQAVTATAQAAAAAAAGPMSTRPGPDNAASWTGNGHKYLLVEQPMTWNEAYTYAMEQGGYLATVTSREEQDFLAEQIKSKGNFWLGGFREGKKWQWVSGEPWQYTGWLAGGDRGLEKPDKLIIMAGLSIYIIQKGGRIGQWAAGEAPGKLGLIIEWDE